MAGQPKKRALLRELERATREYFGDELAPETEKAPPIDYVCEQLAGGRTLSDIARDLARRAGMPGNDLIIVLSNYVHAQPNARERLAAARAQGAAIIAEDVLAVADERVETKADAARQRNRMGARQWLAGAMDPALRPGGKSAGVTVNVGVGELLLDAFRARVPQTERVEMTQSIGRVETTHLDDGATIRATLPSAATPQVVAVQPDDA